MQVARPVEKPARRLRSWHGARRRRLPQVRASDLERRMGRGGREDRAQNARAQKDTRSHSHGERNAQRRVRVAFHLGFESRWKFEENGFRAAPELVARRWGASIRMTDRRLRRFVIRVGVLGIHGPCRIATPVPPSLAE
jgi:hypothetical protein